MIDAYRKKELIDRIDEVETVECPGGPHDGCCEFCNGSCFTYKLDGIVLTDEETDLVDNGLEYWTYSIIQTMGGE